MNTEEIIDRFQNARKSGRGWIVQCPAHDDRKNSLSLTEVDGKLLLKCQAGCDTKAVIDAVGLEWRDLFADTGNNKPPDHPVIQRYVYTDENGNPLYRVCRTASKNFFQERCEGGAYIPGLNGTRRVLYNLPDLLRAKTVFVVEGEKDAETLRSHGLVGTTNAGGADAWSDSYANSFKDKWVFIIPDNDQPGRKHAWRVARSVLPFAKEVRLIELPDVPEKGDVTDYLAKHTSEELRDLVRAAKRVTDKDAHEKSKTKSQETKKDKRKPVTVRVSEVNGASSEINPGPYTVDGGCICKIHYSDKGGVTYEPLCNFDAKVAEEILLDDGAEATRAFIINGKLSDGKTLPPCRIPASRFAGMSWVTESWGLRAVVNAGNAKRDALREAIQRLSPDTKTRQIFAHTGWREVGGNWIYLSGSMTGTDQFEVDLGSELLRYKLPAVPGNQVEAIKTSLKLLDLAPLRITAPLFAACYRAPLVSAFPQDLSIWIEGKTGSMKSTLAALFLSHFGDFDRIHLPGAWSSTANQLERRAFLLKDTLFVIDDYAPAGLDHREMETKAARLLRAQGNISGRGRLRSDLTERPAFPPRGVILSTGEQHPPGQSLLARTLIIELDQTDIDVQSLTQAQEQSAKLAGAMAGYIAWLAPQMGNMPQLLRETFRGSRTKATAGREHLRIPEAAAHLWCGLHCGLTYAREVGALSVAEMTGLGEKCWKAFLEIGREQAKIVEDEKPARRFLGVLYTIIAQGRVTLLPKDETPGEPRPGVDFIGWRDDDFLYLLPEATYAAVVRFCWDTREYFPSRQERLKRDLAKEKISECDPGRFTTTARIDNHTRRVLKLSLNQIKELLGEDITDHHQYHHFKMGERDGL